MSGCVKSFQKQLTTAIFFVINSSVLVAVNDPAAPTYTSNVGMPNTIVDLILPGSALEVRPLDNHADPVVVRIASTIPHGTAHRYQIVYYGLEPGIHNLADYLQRTDATSSDDVPEILVRVEPLLPAGQVQPNPLTAQKSESIGGYRTKLLLAGVLWLAGLLAILFVGRRTQTDAQRAGGQGATLADRLRPIVDDAMQGRLTQPKQAELERLLLTYWRQRLNLNDVKASEAMTTLREHEEAGRLLRQLESWLHKPAHRQEQVDVNELLEPYRHMRDPTVA